MKRIGILGGSFNPIHNAHIKLAKTAIKYGKLDKVLIIPTYISNLKDNSFLVSSLDRLNMCKLAVSDDEKLEVSDIEIKREGISYTSDTIKELNKENDKKYFLIMGADQFLKLEHWHESEYLMQNVSFIIAPRDDEDYSDNLVLSKKYNIDNELVLIKEYIEDLSSTKIREMIKNGKDVSMYINEKVYEYIKERKLYL